MRQRGQAGRTVLSAGDAGLGSDRQSRVGGGGGGVKQTEFMTSFWGRSTLGRGENRDVGDTKLLPGRSLQPSCKLTFDPQEIIREN